MIQIIIIFILLILIFLLFENSTPEKSFNSPKKLIHQYLCDFNVYLCLKNKIFLFPPKEISLNNRYYTLNLHTENKLLPHKCMNGNGLLKNSSMCTECINRCSLYSSDIIDLRMNFDCFRKLNNEELKHHLKSILTPKQFEELFDNKK